MAKLCHQCSALGLQRAFFLKSASEYAKVDATIVRSSTVGELDANRGNCELCDLIWRCLERSDSDALASARNDETWILEWDDGTNDWEPDDIFEGELPGHFGSALCPNLSTSDGRGRADYRIQLVDDIETDEFLRARVVRSDVDIEKLKGWISSCQQEHGDSCVLSRIHPRRLNKTNLSSLTVIDVNNLQLCPLPHDAAYVALSYVWGPNNHPVNLVATNESFARKQGLAITLPQTIRDAIDLVNAMGYRHLWVDSLCITQDGDQKMELIESMDAIYSSAIFTIVAATSDGAHSGLSGISNKHGRDQHLVRLDDDLQLGVLPYYHRELFECHHATRAWTYQETCLSQRCLLFLNGFAYFNCNVALYAEHTNAEFPGIQPEASGSTLGKSNTEVTLRRFAEHVQAYMSRELTYPSDAHNAFRGVSNALIEGMSGEIFMGLPVSCFDWAVLWTGNGSLERRSGFPSWSWMGWIGDILMSQDTYGPYEQMWLLRATWIKWHRATNEAGFTAIWNSDDLAHSVSPAVQEVLDKLDRQDAEAAAQGRNKSVETEDRDIDEEDEGDDNGDGDDEEDDSDDPCPTYGYSSPANPFGRRISPEVVQLLSGPPAYQLEHSCIEEEDFPDHKTMLFFSAPVITLAAGPLTTLPSHPKDTVSPLQDAHGRTCGFLSVCDHGTCDVPDDKSVQLLLLSVTSYGDLYNHHATGRIAAIDPAFEVDVVDLERYLQALPEDLDRHEFMNVMFIRERTRKIQLRQGGKPQTLPVCERAGLGFVHHKALRHCGGMQWQEILLG